MTDDYIERRLNWIEGDRQYQGEEADILRQQRPVVVLGEPGMGKTELLKRLGDDPNAQFVRAAAFLRWTNGQMTPGNVLVIDALDEVAAKAEGVGLLAVLHIAALRRDLPVGVELDPVRRIEIDALHLAAQRLPFGEARHHLKAVAQNHPVRPMLVMLVKFRARIRRDTVEIGEQVRRGRIRPAGLRGAAFQIINYRLGVDFLLNIKRRHVDDQVRPVLCVLAAPHQLRIAEFKAAVGGKLLHLRRCDLDARTVPDQLRIELAVALARFAGRKGPRTRISDRRTRRAKGTEGPADRTEEKEAVGKKWTAVSGNRFVMAKDKDYGAVARAIAG